MVYASRVVGFASGLLVVPILIIHLGIDGFGLWALATAVFGYSGLFEAGVSGAVTKFVAQYRGEKNEIALRAALGSALTFSLIAGAGAAGLLTILGFVGPGLLGLVGLEKSAFSAVMAIMAVRAVFAFALALPEAVVKGYERYDRTSMTAVIVHVSTFVAIISWLSAGGGIVEVTMVSVMIPCLAGTMNALTLRRIAPELSIPFVRHPLLRSPDLFRYSIAGLVVSVTTVMMYQADYLIVGALLSTTTVGIYAVVAKLNQAVRELDWLSLQSIVPLASRLDAAGDTAKENTLLRTGAKYLAAFEYTIVSALMVFSGPILQVWVGPSFTAWGNTAALFLSYMLFLPGLSVAGYILIGRGRMGTIVRATVLMAAINVSSSLALTVLLGTVQGVIVGTIIGVTVAYPYWVWAFARELRVRPRDIVGPTLAAYPGAAIAAGIGIAFQILVPSVSLLTVLAGLVLSAAGGWFAFLWLFVPAEERRLVVREILGARLADSVRRPS